MDLEYIITKDISSIGPNVLTTYEKKWRLNNSFLRFEKYHPLINLAMHLFMARYNPTVWGWQGPTLLDTASYFYRKHAVTSSCVEQRQYEPYSNAWYECDQPRPFQRHLLAFKAWPKRNFPTHACCN